MHLLWVLVVLHGLKIEIMNTEERKECLCHFEFKVKTCSWKTWNSARDSSQKLTKMSNSTLKVTAKS